MEHKSWPWKKKSSEKTLVASNKANTAFKGFDNEKVHQDKKAGPERFAEASNQAFASIPCDCSAKDELLDLHVKMAEDAIAGKEKAEAEVIALKQELDEASQLGLAAKEQLAQLDAELKVCLQQLDSVREDQEQRIQDVVALTSSDYEKAQKILQDKLTETTTRLNNLIGENGNLSMALQLKDKLIDELRISKSQSEAEFDALMERLDSTEKENSFLRYEFRMLEKELEIRGEEREFNRRSADALQKQQLESVRKVAKLESECQRLRGLLRKRLPGPAAMAIMKGEVEILARDQSNMTRRELVFENSPENPNKKISVLMERLRSMEEENKTLQEKLAKKDSELQESRFTCARISSKLAGVEAQTRELSRQGNKSLELVKYSPASNVTSDYDICSDDKLSNSGSWANALTSELQQFRSKNLQESKRLGTSDMSLMDDFVEMEKLAIVSADMPLERDSSGSHPNLTGKELVPVPQGQSSFDDSERDIITRDVSSGKPHDWLQDVLKAVQEENRVSKRCISELLEDIRIALGFVNHPKAKTAEKAVDPLEDCGINMSLVEADSDLSKSARKIITLIEGINPKPSRVDGSSDNRSSADHVTHIFQWKRSELSAVLSRFIEASNKLLNREASFEIFTQELTIALGWILSCCIVHEDTSSIREKIKKQFGWDRLHTENEKVGGDSPIPETNNTYDSKRKISSLSKATSFQGENDLTQMQKNQPNSLDENRRLKSELKNLEAIKKELEESLQSAANKSEALVNQLRESEQSIENLRTELETLRDSKGVIEDQFENQKSINEDLDTQLTVARIKLNQALQKFLSLEAELENKSSCCEELEAACLELQLQLESAAKKESPKSNPDQEEKQMHTGWELSTASVKLAECQETILNLGKQLKALASPRETALFDKVFSTTATNNKTLIRRSSSLLDQMIAEDASKAHNSRNLASNGENQSSALILVNNHGALPTPNLQESAETYLSSFHRSGSAGVGALTIVPSKKKGGGGSFLRKLLVRRKKWSSKKTSLTFGKV